MARSNLTFGVLLTALVAIAAFELSPAARPVRGPSPLPAAPPPATLSAAPGAEPVAAYTDQILARPLFTQGRRPAAAAAAPVAQDKPPRLSGILVAGGDRRAIFEAGEKPVVGVVGTQIGAYRILAITPLQVTLQGPGGILAMDLTYGAKAAVAAAPTAPSIVDQLNSGTQLPPGMPKTPTLQEMMANLPKTLPPVVNGIPVNDTRAAR